MLKGAQLRTERYQLAVPVIAPPAPPDAEPFADGVAPANDDAFAAAAHAFDAFDGPLHVDVPAFDAAAEIEAARAQAGSILDEAARGAEAILADAHGRARTLVEDAVARAEAVTVDARRRGRGEGFDAGRAEADREMSDMLATMRGLLEMARAERHKLIEDAEPELVRLALGIAERVLHQQIALDRGVVVEMAKNAITRLIDRDAVTVRVNPADLERMREHRSELKALGDMRTLRIVEDKRVDRGGVVVDTGGGTIDARVATQLDEARKVLHIEDDVVVEAAPEGRPAKPDFAAARAS